jgi:hypothetical protein
MRSYGTNRVFPECDACGHPRVSHTKGTCFCGCSGSREKSPLLFNAEPTVATVAARYGARDGWTDDEDMLLEKRFRDGVRISELSALHQRRPSSIIARLEQLSLVDPRRRPRRTGILQECS